jgi:hypothetical protein
VPDANSRYRLHGGGLRSLISNPLCTPHIELCPSVDILTWWHQRTARGVASVNLSAILSFRFHIHDHYLVFISFENVLGFFIPSPFFCILSTSSPTYVCNFSILIPHRTSFFEFQSVQTHLGMWQKKKKKKSLTLIILRSVRSKILKISPCL